MHTLPLTQSFNLVLKEASFLDAHIDAGIVLYSLVPLQQKLSWAVSLDDPNVGEDHDFKKVNLKHSNLVAV